MPRPDGRPLLPIDTPPSNRVTRLPNVAGLMFAGSPGTVRVPFPTVPWNPWESVEFPAVEGSNAAATIDRTGILPVIAAGGGMNALRPRWGAAINAYSPIAHRTAPALRDGVPPRAISARGVGRVTQRPRGYAPGYSTSWPQIAPRWPTFGEAPGARGGR